MKKDKRDLLRAMSDIDDKYIQEVLDEDMGVTDPKFIIFEKKRRMRKTVWSVVAVAAACLLGFAMINVLETGVKTSYESASDSAAPAAGAEEETAQPAGNAKDASDSGDAKDEAMMSPSVIADKDEDNEGAETGAAGDAQDSAETTNEAASSTEAQATDDTAVESAEETGATEGEIFEARIPELGLSLTVTDPSNTGATLVWKQKGGDVTGDLEFSKAYKIEVFDGSSWVEVEMADDVAFEDIAMSILKDSTTEYELDWSSVYGELPAGTYRVVMTVNDYRGAGDYDTYTTATEFQLE